jgi:hypothetical protein
VHRALEILQNPAELGETSRRAVLESGFEILARDLEGGGSRSSGSFRGVGERRLEVEGDGSEWEGVGIGATGAVMRRGLVFNPDPKSQ